VAPASILVNNSLTNYTFSGPGAIINGTLTKTGGGNLAIQNTNTCNVVVAGGTLLLGSSGALSGSNAVVMVYSNGCVNFNNQQAAALTCIISGAGCNGLGTLVQNSGQNNAYGPGSLTLAGSATIGGTNRWDLRNGANTLNSPTNAYALTKVGPGLISLVNTLVSSNLGDLNLLGGMLAYELNTTGLGNPTNTLRLGGGTKLELWAATVPLNKNIVCSNGASLEADSGNASGLNVIAGPVTLAGGTVNLASVVFAGLYLSNAISGPGALTVQAQTYAYLAASNTFTGSLTVSNGNTASGGLGARLSLIGNGSATQAGQIYLQGSLPGAAYAGYLDASGRVDGTLTLGSNQILRGDNGSLVRGNAVVPAGAAITAGAISSTNYQYMIFSNSLTLQSGSTNFMEIYKTGSVISNSVVVIAGALTNQGAVLQIGTNGALTALAAGDTFKLFNAAAYAGSFALITPGPGSGLIWDVSQLAVNGTLKVRALPSTGTNLMFSVVSNQLTLSWPTNYIGWLLQSNMVDLANTSFWFTVPGSAGTNQQIIPVNPAQTNVFYRMAHP